MLLLVDSSPNIDFLPLMSIQNVSGFIARWKASGAAERANYALFLTELCEVLGVPRPEPTGPDDADNAYVFERNVTFQHADGSTSSGRIDLYKRGCFVLEAKQGVEQKQIGATLPLIPSKRRTKQGTARRGTDAWDEAMIAARGQAEGYARALPASEGRPPFLVVVDVGHSVELYSEFTRTGGTYVAFPDPQSHRILLKDLAEEKNCERLRLVWTDPLALDPTLRSEKVTRDIAERLGRLAKLLEADGHSAAAVAAFLMRALFTMFAEDVELLPRESFLELLKSRRGRLETLIPKVEELWSRMNTGGFSNALDAHIRHFNGGLFADSTALPLTADQLELLIEAAGADWREVEPSIFGTLLERALDPEERHKLGAHYTPRAYVERIVMPTVVQPLREEWATVQAAVVTLVRQEKEKDAVAEIESFHRRLCEVRVLDPACGSANFLYVTLEHLKRLEGEVLNSLASLDQTQASLEMQGFTVDSRQLLGVEFNPRAAAIAELVLWIGYLQWHFRTRGNVPPREPIIQNFRNIECRDGVLAWDQTEPVLDESTGQPVTRWDGRTTKKHPVTGAEVPDDTALVPSLRYAGARKAAWPEAEFIVGNPPFIGNKRMRNALGNGYVDALRAAWRGVPETADYVMYWWQHAAELAMAGKIRRFGFITTNSITQTFNRQVVQAAMEKDLGLIFAIPDHPWVDSADGASVRIAMTVGKINAAEGTLLTVTQEKPAGGDGAAEVVLQAQHGYIHADLSCGANVVGAMPLEANAGICFQGMNLVGEGFRVDADAIQELGYDVNAKRRSSRGLMPLPPVIRRYQKGRPLVQGGDSGWVLDCFGLTERELQMQYPSVFQHLFDHVKPERDHNNRASRKKNWWLFGEPVGRLRKALGGLTRYIVTVETSKFKPFVFLEADVVPDHTLYAIASDDAFVLGVLSSHIHGAWASAAGGTLEDRPRWQNSITFLPFPFPEATDEQKARIRQLGEELDAHRKGQQSYHSALNLTDMYNVLERLRAKTDLTDKERVIHQQGLLTVLKRIHDDLDAAVADAYGWPGELTEQDILARLVALNTLRMAEEKAGTVRWLRPALQNPTTASEQQVEIDLADGVGDSPSGKKSKGVRPVWPARLPDQIRAVQTALGALTGPVTPAILARGFAGAPTAQVNELLDTLSILGQARRLKNGKYVVLA